MSWNKTTRWIYYFLKRFTAAWVKFFKILFTPLSFLKGEDFEKCLRNKVYVKKEYDLVMKTHDFHENQKDYVESSLYPDYLFRNKKTNKEFWVEAKFRTKLYKGNIEWCSYYQLKRYKKLPKDYNTIIAIGFGGRPKNPDKIYLIPLEDLDNINIHPDKAEKYLFQKPRHTFLDRIKDNFYNYKEIK
jgi:hypothetical protein